MFGRRPKAVGDLRLEPRRRSHTEICDAGGAARYLSDGDPDIPALVFAQWALERRSSVITFVISTLWT